jgi:lipopolysaccharide export system protein LptA
MSRRENARSVSGIVGGALAVLMALAGPAPAQTLNNTFGGLSENSDQPIDIESDTLTVYDAKKYATFKGNVKAVQGTTTLRAIELDVHYVGGANKLTGQSEETAPVAPQQATQQAKGDADSAESRINKIEARGSVVITSEDDQTTTSDWAVYDVPAGLVTVGGNVVLSQGQNVLKGDRLVIDLKTGESRFENTGTAATGGRRIRALFMPKDGAKPGDAKPKRKKAGDDAAASPQAPSGPAVDDNEPLPLVPEFR